MIELDIVNDRHLGQIMDKLAALVEKRRVVLVPLNNEPFAVCKTRPLTKVVRYPSDQVARF